MNISQQLAGLRKKHRKVTKEKLRETEQEKNESSKQALSKHE